MSLVVIRRKGGAGPDSLVFGDGNDLVSLLEGDDFADGGAGDDSLFGGEGNDTLAGGAGDDLLNGGPGSDSLFGGDGDDLLLPGLGADFVDGGEGRDTVSFDGAADQYRIRRDGDVVKVELRGGGSTTRVVDVERFVFAGEALRLVKARSDFVEVSESGAVTIDALANDRPGAGALTLVSVRQPDAGSVSIVAGGLRFRTAGDFDALGAGETRTVAIKYRVADALSSAIGRVFVMVVGENDAPVAVDDAFRMAEDATLRLRAARLTANDFDADGDALRLVRVGGAENGKAWISGGVVRFRPDADFHGEAGFFYTVSDGAGGRARAWAAVTVTPVNDPPVAMDDGGEGFAVAADGWVILPDVLANDRDPEGGPLRIAGFDATGAGGTVTLVGGRFRYDAAGAFDHLGLGEVATDRFVYRIADADGLEAEAEVAVQVTGVARNPVAIVVHATGTGGVVKSPEFAVFADGVEIGHGRIANPLTGGLGLIEEGSELYERFVFFAGVEPPTLVEVRFLNDGCDQVDCRDVNLAVDRIEIGGETFQSEIDGYFIAANPASSHRNGPREVLHVNGGLFFGDLDSLL